MTESNKLGGISRKVFAAIFFLSLPVTNFRYFPEFLGGVKVQVKPLLIIPMAVLLILILPGLWKRKLPRLFLPLLVFFILVLISSLLPLIMGTTSPLSETTVRSRLLRTVLTLLIGVAVYITVSLIPESREDLDFSLKWLYGGLFLSLIWSSLQIIYVLDVIPGYYVFFSKLQIHISSNVGTPDRIMGLTLEPSWFADQITAMWLPWVLPAAIHNRTVYQKRWGWITIERILLAWMLVALVFTLSRAGLVVGTIVLAAGFLLFRIQGDPDQLPTKKKGWLGELRRVSEKIPVPVKIVFFSAVGLIIAGLLFYFVGMKNPYIKRMWLYWAKFSTRVDAAGAKSLSGFFRYIGFGPRFVYWETALRIFQAYPLFGVGLGNYTIYFQEFLPAVHVGYMPEILTRIVPDTVRIVTAKNYFFRLLAETGLLGTGAYFTFLIALAAAGLHLWQSDEPENKFWGAGALLGLIAFLADGFSYDSLAIPNPWVVFGLITASFSIITRTVSTEEKIR